MKNIDIKNLPVQLTILVQKLQSYATFIFAIALILSFSFLIFRINTLNAHEPSDDEVLAKLKTVQRPKIDESVVEKIQQLQNNNVEVRALFQQARDNPFQE